MRSPKSSLTQIRGGTRDYVRVQVIVGVDPDPAHKERFVAVDNRLDFMMNGEREDRVKASYRENYGGLASAAIPSAP